MNTNPEGNRSGFTIVEAIVSLVVFGLVILGATRLYNGVMAQARCGAAQCHYLAMARSAEQELASCIREGKAIGVETNQILILQKSDVVSCIEYLDLDANPLTVVNNIIRYDPDIWTSGDEKTICNYVRPVDGQSNIFSSVANSPAAVRIEFHLGDSADPFDSSSLKSGDGYQGFEVRFSAAPRNLQYWYR